MKTSTRVWKVSLLLAGILAIADAEPANTAFGQSNQKPYGERVAQLISGIDEKMVKEFENAWYCSGAGIGSAEAVVLIYQMPGGRYIGRSQGHTNEYEKFSLTWRSNAVAIVHTHPTHSEPEPSATDRRRAEKLNVPVFTITASGMHVYDPTTKKTTMVQNRLDWLDSSKWKASSSTMARK